MGDPYKGVRLSDNTAGRLPNNKAARFNGAGNACDCCEGDVDESCTAIPTTGMMCEIVASAILTPGDYPMSLVSAGLYETDSLIDGIISVEYRFGSVYGFANNPCEGQWIYVPAGISSPSGGLPADSYVPFSFTYTDAGETVRIHN